MNIFSQEDIECLRSLPEVANATETTFTVTLPERIQQVLLEKWGLRVTTVPFRRIKGDTASHIDVGSKSFEKTYLAYLTDGEGTLEIGDEKHAITAGSGFVFPNGTRHGVVNTNGSSRLMLGPMSEAGLAVGGPVYIRQNGSDQEYSFDQVNWSTITWPYSLSGGAVIEFVSDITLTSQTNYFICNGENITIGSRFLNNDGTRPTITVDGVVNYPGLVQNQGYSGVLIYNLRVLAINGSYLDDGAGWIGQSQYGRDGINNFIWYCSSDGPIKDYCGGIVGASAGSINLAGSAVLTIVGCSSSGVIGDNAGGIAGEYLGQGIGSVVLIRNCWSTGEIGNGGGGIAGWHAAEDGNVSAVRCYSMGTIGNGGGGIFGERAGSGGFASTNYCYSQGTITNEAGGMFGRDAGLDLGNITAESCYSSGVIQSGGFGIFGNTSGSTTEMNCYIANNAWNTATATATLGLTNYVSVAPNEPFLLRNFGPSPYVLNTVNDGGADLTLTYSETVAAGVPSASAVIPNLTYVIVSGSGGTINSSTGSITAATGGSYTFTVLAVDGTTSYSMTTVTLTVTGGPPTPTPLATPGPQNKGNDFEIYMDNKIGKRLVQERLQNQNIRFNSFADYNKYLRSRLLR